MKKKTRQKLTIISSNLNADPPAGGLEPKSKYLDVNEAAEYLRVSAHTIYDWVHQKTIPHRHHGRKLVFLITEIDRWSDGNMVPVRGDD